MKKIYLFLLTALMLGFTGCKEDEDGGGGGIPDVANVKFNEVSYYQNNVFLYKNKYNYNGELLNTVTQDWAEPEIGNFVWTYTYAGNDVTELGEYTEEPRLFTSSKRILTFTGDNVTEELIYDFDLFDEEFYESEGHVNEYNGSGQLTRITASGVIFLGDDWELRYQSNYIYEDGQLKEIKTYRYEDGVLESFMSEHVTLQYDGEKLTNFIIYVGDMSGLEPYYKAEFEYSGDRIAESRGYSYSGSTPVLDVTKTFSYNSSGQIATALQDTHDGNLVRAEYTYLDGTSNTYQLITPTHLKAYNLPLYGRMSEDAQKRLKVMKTMSKVLPSIFWADLSN